jgi:hypothetical protein
LKEVRDEIERTLRNKENQRLFELWIERLKRKSFVINYLLMTGWIAISLGDVTGIGPEVTLKALAAEAEQDDTRYLLIGDSEHTAALYEQLGLQLPLQPFSEFGAEGRFFLHNPLREPLPPGLEPGSPAAARAAVAWLTDGAQRCLSHETDALVTAPLNKEAIVRSGQPFIGQTEFLSQLAGTDRTVMMLLGDDDRGRWLRVALATTHLPLKLVPEQLSAEKIELAIELAAKACQDLGLPAAAWPSAASIRTPAKAANLAARKSTLSSRRSRRCKRRAWTSSGRCRPTRSFITLTGAIMTRWWRCTTTRAWGR